MPTLTHLQQIAMDFAHRLATTRKQQGLTQQVLAERAQVHVTQIRRYEAGTSAPTLDVLRNLAIALSTTTDSLIFGHDERGPDNDLRLVFEGTRHLDPDEQAIVKHLIEAVLLKHEARRWTTIAS